MALSRANTSAKTADVTKLLPLNKHQLTHPPMHSMVVPPPHLTTTLTITKYDLDYHQDLTVSSVDHMPPFHQIFCETSGLISA